ncbi:hypothetical protein G6F35_013708 [Rhizopus arrhizus]|nr:hypothetical protein G6F35_013708 [Rhizopus arrhizus]
MPDTTDNTIRLAQSPMRSATAASGGAGAADHGRDQHRRLFELSGHLRRPGLGRPADDLCAGSRAGTRPAGAGGARGAAVGGRRVQRANGRRHRQRRRHPARQPAARPRARRHPAGCRHP